MISYDAINEIKDAIEDLYLLAPTQEEVITGNIEVREVFKISKIGAVAGCYVTDGTVKRSHKIRIIRDFIVVHTSEISALNHHLVGNHVGNAVGNEPPKRQHRRASGRAVAADDLLQSHNDVRGNQDGVKRLSATIS